MRAPRTLVIAAATAVVLTATACGDAATSSAGGAATSTSTSGTAAGTVRDADHAFAAGMIPHHEQAIEMAAVAQARATTPEVRRLAADIRAAQAPEIERMRGWLDAWGPAQSSGGHGGHGGGAGDGMLSESQMKQLEAATGSEVDRLFLEGMIEHHRGAVAMAEVQREQGGNPEARALAEAIITSQTAEIEKMRRLLDQLG